MKLSDEYLNRIYTAPEKIELSQILEMIDPDVLESFSQEILMTAGVR